MNKGVILTEEARQHPEVSKGLIKLGKREEIVFSLSEDFFVRTFVLASGKRSPTVKIQKEKLFLDNSTESLEISIIPPPHFIEEKDKNRNPISSNIKLDGYCLNLYLRLFGRNKTINMGFEGALSIIRSAFEEGVADLIQINMDFCEDKDRGFQHIAPLIKLIKKNFRTFVALRGFPPEDMGTIDNIYAAGVDLLVFPLDGFSIHSPTKKRIPALINLEALEYASGVFPQGTVSTELTLNVDSPDFIKEKISEISSKGILPILQLPQTGLKDQENFKPIQDIIAHLEQTAKMNKLNLKWMYPSADKVSALDGVFFLQNPNEAKLVQKPIYKTTLGKTATEGFTALRRKLRVKNISDSYESAGL